MATELSLHTTAVAVTIAVFVWILLMLADPDVRAELAELQARNDELHYLETHTEDNPTTTTERS